MFARSPRPTCLHRATRKGGFFMPIIRSGYTGRAARAKSYNHAHRTLRRKLASHVEAGLTRCSICHQQIKRGEQWDLDHTPDRTGYRGPAHAVCNRGGRYGGGV